MGRQQQEQRRRRGGPELERRFAALGICERIHRRATGWKLEGLRERHKRVLLATASTVANNFQRYCNLLHKTMSEAKWTLRSTECRTKKATLFASQFAFAHNAHTHTRVSAQWATRPCALCMYMSMYIKIRHHIPHMAPPLPPNPLLRHIR